jgi:predicted nucleic acid-binding protein
MASGVLLDTGPLVAYLWQHDRYHKWTAEQFAALDLPLITCEPVITEACFLTARNRVSPVHVLETVERGVIRLDFQLSEEIEAVRGLMARYASVPMSLADACLVRLAEMTGLPICTLDSDFAIYRAQRRRPLTLISPNGPGYMHEV